MEEDDETETECLLTLRIIPVTHLVKVDSLVHRVKNGGKKTTHKCQIMLINWLKLRDELNVIGVDIACIFLVDKFGGFLFNCQINDSLELFAPYLFTLNVQEVLDILDRTFKADKIALDLFEFFTKFTEGCPSSLNFSTLSIAFYLLIGVGVVLSSCCCGKDKLCM